MKKVLIVLVTCFICLGVFLVNANDAYADMGPHPSVELDLKGVSLQSAFCTLLSKDKSTGPHAAYNGSQKYGDSEYPEIWEKFNDYAKNDDFFFIQFFTKVKDNKFRWSYYPPKTFKVLIYSDVDDTFYVSKVISTYALNSYYGVTAEGTNLAVNKTYNYSKEIGLFALRVVLTIIVEISLALILGYRGKKTLIVLLLTNVITQIVLNALLAYVYIKEGSLILMIDYFIGEVIVLFIETFVYLTAFTRLEGKKGQWWFILLYTIFANIFSFGLGLIIFKLL